MYIEEVIKMENEGNVPGAMKILYPILDELMKNENWAALDDIMSNNLPVNTKVALLIFTAKAEKTNFLNRESLKEELKNEFGEEIVYGL